MTRRNRRSSNRAFREMSETAVAAPLVVAHRLTRMITAGATPSASDRREFQRMGEEKIAAFGESWNAMAWEMLRSNQNLALALMTPWWGVKFGDWSMYLRPLEAWQNSSITVVGKGITPVHRQAVANSKRLGKLTKH